MNKEKVECGVASRFVRIEGTEPGLLNWQGLSIMREN